MTPFWVPATGPGLEQGDYLPNCLVPLIPPDFGPSDHPTDIPLAQGDLVVVTHSGSD